MRIRLTAFTVVHPFIIFDSAAVPAGTVTPMNLDPMIDTLSSDGRAIFYFSDSDGFYHFDIYVDESPDNRLLQLRENSIAHALLCVPSGRLLVTCYEDLTSVKLLRSTQHVAGKGAEIPAGNYHVDVFDLNKRGDEFEKECTRRAVLGDVRIESLFNAMMNVEMILTLFVTPVVCLLCFVNAGWGIGLLFLVSCIAMNVLLWLITNRAINNSGACQRMQSMRRELQEEYPDVVVVLRRCADLQLPTTITPGKVRAGC